MPGKYTAPPFPLLKRQSNHDSHSLNESQNQPDIQRNTDPLQALTAGKILNRLKRKNKVSLLKVSVFRADHLKQSPPPPSPLRTDRLPGIRQDLQAVRKTRIPVQRAQTRAMISGTKTRGSAASLSRRVSVSPRVQRGEKGLQMFFIQMWFGPAPPVLRLHMWDSQNQNSHLSTQRRPTVLVSEDLKKHKNMSFPTFCLIFPKMFQQTENTAKWCFSVFLF